MPQTQSQPPEVRDLRICITGANGFVGAALTTYLARHSNHHIVAASRQPIAHADARIHYVKSPSLSSDASWEPILKNVDCVVHTAARVHILHDAAADPLAEYRKTNVDGTLKLARAAAQAGVKRFIFLSSIKVNGESTSPGHPFRASDMPVPVDPYGISKWEAEEGLRQITHETGMESVIIRPPLVYGPGVKANFKAMLKLLSFGLPLPFGSLHNKRSLVGMENLLSLITTCLTSSAAANRTFLAADGEDVSTTELLQTLGRTMGKNPMLIPVPLPLLRGALRLAGKANIAQRLCDSLQVAIEETRTTLDWKPPLSLEAGLTNVANWYMHDRSET